MFKQLFKNALGRHYKLQNKYINKYTKFIGQNCFVYCYHWCFLPSKIKF